MRNWFTNIYHSRIAAKLVVATIIFSSFIALLATAFELYTDYREQLEFLDSSLVHIEANQLSSLATSLWQQNDETLHAQLAAISGLPDVQFVEIQPSDGANIVMGNKTNPNVISRSFPLFHRTDGQEVKVGDLKVALQLDRAMGSVFNKLPLTLATNFAKIIFISIFLFFVFHYLVTRRLRNLATAINSVEEVSLQSESTVGRRGLVVGVADELDDVGNAISNMKRRLQQLYRNLHEVNTDLQTKINEQTIIEDSLRDSEDRLKKVISAAPVVLFVTDIHGRIQMFDGLSARSLKLKVVDPVGFSVFDVFDDDRRFQSLLKRALDGEKFTAEVQLDNVSFEIRFSPIKHQNGENSGFIAVALDITNRINYESKLVEAKQAAENANRAKSQFIANVSHEIRTPLGAIMGFTELLNSQWPPDDATKVRMGSEYVATIRRNAQALLNLVNDLLDLSKIESGQLVIDKQICSVPEIIGEVLVSLTPAAQKKDIKIETTILGHIPETITTDPMRLRQILTNVIGNAIKFSSRSWVYLRFRLDDAYSHHEHDHDDHLLIDVKDSGIGISEDEQDKIFRPFVQTDASVARRFGGSGLGLSVSRRLAQALGGDVVLTDSSPGIGSNFTISVATGDISGVRMIDSFLDQLPRPEPAVGGEASELLGAKVLVVEDSEDNQILFKTYLESAAAVVDIANGGQEGLKKALQGSYDVVLMDIQMPDIDGYQVTSILRSKDYSVPIIALTAHAMKGDLEKCLAAGCNYYLSKPVTRNQLVSQVVRFWQVSQPYAVKAAESPSQLTVQEPPADTDTVSSSSADVSKAGDISTSVNALTSSSQGDQALDLHEWQDNRYVALRSEYEDDPRMVQIIEEFKRRLPRRILSLQQALSNGNLKQVGDLAHQLRGALGGYGFPTLCQEMAALEDDLRVSQDANVVQRHLTHLDALARSQTSSATIH